MGANRTKKPHELMTKGKQNRFVSDELFLWLNAKPITKILNRNQSKLSNMVSKRESSTMTVFEAIFLCINMMPEHKKMRQQRESGVFMCITFSLFKECSFIE